MKIIYLVLVYYVVVMGNTSLVSSDYIVDKQRQRRQLFDALQLALINDSTTLYKLQEMFYPPGAASPDTVAITSIVTVNTILFPNNNSCYYYPRAFENSSNHYVRKIDRFSVSNDAFSNSRAKLTAYINSFKRALEKLEYTSYHLIMTITNNMQLSSSSNTYYYYEYDHELNLEVDKLEVIPCENDYVEAMSSVLSWARYYAKLYNHDPLKNIPTKLDTDRGIINYCTDKCNEDSNYNYYNSGDSWLWPSLFPLNILIAIVGLYCLNLIITKYEHNNSSRRIDFIYWASVIIAGVINITCLVIDTRWFVQDRYAYYFLVCFRLPLGILLLLVEPVAAFIVVKKFRISLCVRGCCSKPLVMRLVHTLAICHLLGFLHRLGSGLIVAAFFIALAPGQTLAALSLMYLVILVSTVYVACCIYFLQNRRKKWQMVCKLFLLTITYLCMVGLAIFFTLIYIALSENGLTSSTIGSLLLSLIPPMAIFFIGLAIKRQLKGSNILGSNNGVDSIVSESPDSDHNERGNGTILKESTLPLVEYTPPLVQQSLV